MQWREIYIQARSSGKVAEYEIVEGLIAYQCCSFSSDRKFANQNSELTNAQKPNSCRENLREFQANSIVLFYYNDIFIANVLLCNCILLSFW